MTRRVLMLIHPGRRELRRSAGVVAERFAAAGIDTIMPAEHGDDTPVHPRIESVDLDSDPAHGVELVLVLGGDGSILRGAELSRGSGAPLMGINYGHVGFLAEADDEDLPTVVDRIIARDYTVEERTTLDVVARVGDRIIAQGWALNEVTVEKASRERMLDLSLEIDGRPLSTWGCDGIVVSTPTGSTAYAFSAGGPVTWPDVEAFVIVPLSAHALFARPLVVGPQSAIAIELVADSTARAVMWCDGARPVDLPASARIDVTRSTSPVRLARLGSTTFTDRLVDKFTLSVEGWRGRPRRGRP